MHHTPIHNQSHTLGIMLSVVLALIPGIAMMVLGFGGIVLWHLLISTLAALLSEAAMLHLQKRAVLQSLLDGSALLTALLLAISLPPYAPWWLFALGATLAIILGKQIYGGLGQNLFNPAMVGYVILLVSMPHAMTHWAAPSFPWMEFGNIDAITQATPLDTAQIALKAQQAVPLALTKQFGTTIAGGFEWISLGWLVGGFMLWRQRLIAWRLPVCFLASYTLLSWINWQASNGQSLPVATDLLSGSLMFAAFFIITDPVTAATSKVGQIIFACGIAAITFVIRHFGTYSDGIAFAVLVMNGCVPLIDQYTIPRLPHQPRRQ